MKKITDWSAIFSIAGKTCFLFAVAFMLSPSAVQAQCQQWEMSGTNWYLQIGDTRATDVLYLSQSGTKVSGWAEVQQGSAYFPSGKVTGDIKGDKIKFEILWEENKQAGRTYHEHFKGTIGPDGKIEGQAFIFTIAGGINVVWTMSDPLTCRYKTVHQLGTKPTTPTTPSRYKTVDRLGTKPTTPTTPTAVNAPTITASQPIPVTGQVMLEWDGGKDHPYAEVWVKVDDGDETFIVEQGKGARQVTVEPGKTYLYILADAGERLATVTVKSRQ